MREPSARSWITSPRTPRSLMTTSLPRPRTRCGMLARARESDEGAQLEDVVDGREQVGRSADAHRREPRQRLVARGLDADPALDVRSDRDRVERGRGGHAADPRARRSMMAAVGQRLAPCGGEHEVGHGVRRPGPAERAGRRGHREVGRRIVEQRRGIEQCRRRRSASSSTSRRRAGLDELRGHWPAGARRHADTGRRRIGRPRAVTSASVDEPARPTTRSAAASAASMSSRRNGCGR